MKAKRKPTDRLNDLIVAMDTRFGTLEEKIDKLIHNLQGIKSITFEGGDDDEEEEDSSGYIIAYRHLHSGNKAVKCLCVRKYFAGHASSEVEDRNAQTICNWVKERRYAILFPTHESASKVLTWIYGCGKGSVYDGKQEVTLHVEKYDPNNEDNEDDDDF